ncbi:hypothetical protein [Gynuella sp.]|uniref:hypothetical protein n=1 Tax=Gynuella sp. TaxID=2969146 RepID=UPI003D0B8956
MNIEQLRSIRNKNIQQQNELMYLEIKELAESFRNHQEGYPWLLTLLSKYSLHPNDGLLVSCASVPGQGGNQWMGTWLTCDRRFVDFDVMADYKTGILLEVGGWDEYSPVISEHCKGTGKSFGYLALQLLTEYGKS